MMRQAIDVEMELQYAEIERMGREAAIQTIIGKMRHTAQGLAEEAGGSLVVSVLPEIVVERTSSILLGGDLLLVASRWAADVPYSFRPEAVR